MDSQHSGSDLIFLESEHYSLQISDSSAKRIHLTEGNDESRVTLSGNPVSVELIENNPVFVEKYGSISSPPLFFEQKDYVFILRPKNNKKVLISHENEVISTSFKNIRGTDITHGLVNFRNSIGYTKFIITLDGVKINEVELEVFPSKIRYKEDYIAIREDISREIYNLIFDFLNITYQNYSTSNKTGNSNAEFFAILHKIYGKLIQSFNRIIEQPHHIMVRKDELIPDYKVKRLDGRSIKWLEKNPSKYRNISQGSATVKILSPKKYISYNTTENKFVKFMAMAIVKRLSTILKLYSSKSSAQKSYLEELKRMKSELNARLQNSFLADLEIGNIQHSMSLVFSMSAGYREFYKAYVMLTHSLDIKGDIFNIPIKNMAQLYEYWCFIKIYAILKEYYPLHSQSLLTINDRGLSVQLVKGKESAITMRKLNSKETITISYNRQYSQNIPTTVQIPDNVLKIERKDDAEDYDIEYIFDAKYRIDPALKNTAYYEKYGGPGPVEDSINAMHRYRDAIVYKNEESYYRTMAGAFVLFPFADENKQYHQHPLYKSIDKVNIGGIPFLPCNTDMLIQLLDNLIINPVESCKKRFVRSRITKGELNLDDSH